MNDEIKSLIFEACNEWVSMGLPRTHEIHECFMRSTGNRDKHPAPLCALAKWALTDDVRHTPSEEARLVSYHPDGDTCTLNINGVEMYYDRVDRDTQPTPSVPDDGFKRAVMEIKDIGYGAIFKHLICERAAELAAAPKPETKP